MVDNGLDRIFFDEERSAPQPHFVSVEDRPPWAGILIVSALLVFYVVVILTAVFAHEATSTATPTETAPAPVSTAPFSIPQAGP